MYNLRTRYVSLARSDRQSAQTDRAGEKNDSCQDDSGVLGSESEADGKTNQTVGCLVQEESFVKKKNRA